MKHYSRMSLIVLAAIPVILALAALGPAQAGPQSVGGDYSIDKWTVGAGGVSSGGSYTLSGTAGQHDAGQLSGGNLVLNGGFWGQAAETLYRVFLPEVLRNY